MTITELRDKCKAKLPQVPKDALILSILVVASTLSFWFGYLAGNEVKEKGSEALTGSPVAAGVPGEVVASKSGTKYYPPDCSGALRISETNKVWFVSAAAAEEAGYARALNCSGL